MTTTTRARRASSPAPDPMADEPTWMREWREAITASVQKLTDAVEGLRVSIWPRPDIESALRERVSTDQYRLEMEHLRGRVAHLEARPANVREWLVVGVGCAAPLIGFVGTVLGILGTMLIQYLF